MDKNIIERLFNSIKDKKSFAYVTIIASYGSTPRDCGSSMIVFEDGSIYGSIGGGILEKKAIEEAKKCIKNGESKRISFSLTPNGINALCMGKVDIFVDVYKNTSEVILLGAGHVSKAVSTILDFLSIPYSVVDERREFANRENFPNAVEIIVDYPYKFDKYLKINQNNYILILTREHRFDSKCLEKAIKTKATYIGMIGSKSKVKETFEKFKKRGINLAKDLRVFSPVGINCGGKTPQEIAISIVAEILSVKYNTKKISHMRSLIGFK